MYLFAECQRRHSAKFIKCRVPVPLHSALQYVCRVPQFGTRRSITVTAVEKWERSWQQRNGLGELACAVHVTVFVECPLVGTRQTITAVRPPHRNGRVRACVVHVTLFAECLFRTLGEDGLCRVPACQHTAKRGFVECQPAGTRQRYIPPSVSCSPSAFW